MVTLKNPEAQIPNGLYYIQAETGWDSRAMIGTFPSMDTLTRGTMSHREGNPWLAQKHGWSMDYQSVLKEMRDYNAMICLKNGWMNFIITNEAAPVEPPVIQKKTLLSDGAAVGSIKRVAAGIGVFLDWVGDGATPVAVEVAERRAKVCSGCIKNDGGDFKAYFTEPIAAKIKKQLEIKNDLQLKTSLDEKLTVCSACDCPLKLKVWVPLEHILEHTSKEVKTRLWSNCWILRESP